MADPVDVICMACDDASAQFTAKKFQRRAVGDEDVLLDMKYCGVCHTDVHIAANHAAGFNATVYPCVPGHELAGICVQVGSKVTKVKVGDHVGVGCMVDSCLSCVACERGDENYCRKMNTGTYQGDDNHGRAATYPEGGKTIGGYTSKMVVHQHFAILIPKTYPLECAGPVMCAGITLYEPLKVYKAGPGTRVGVVGVGGLGLTGIKIAEALGCEVTAISRGNKKKAIAAENGATGFINSLSTKEMTDAVQSLDLVLNTVPTEHDHSVYQKLVAPGGKQVILGFTNALLGNLLGCAITGDNGPLTSSGIGGIKNTQEVIDLCDKHKIYPSVKVCPVTDLGKIYTALDASNDDGVRYVLDISGSLKEGAASTPPTIKEPVKAISMGGVFSELFNHLFLRYGCRSA
eukprot:TRINITY_DN55845_c0_g1_i1.p1 TRINITY_DN55845_c0_g1~~TRINITY_DN55845_c0_g1_i1.p1  ORF type:complete len:404 (+),score=65.25 TRINITY_DN55845_c0_g1_i1:71-1282(+)